ncbi:Pex12 amino terminal region-domain-containing protein [Lipomyces arxii]|uniref:Pex12 amino terminal region-domain-containing protein n=1 Tax=Lipomyces arxii TaxID=56418 RepID=UPI0034CE06ED
MIRLLDVVFSSFSRSTYPSIRVGQLDSDRLDDELFEILKNQIWESSKFIKSSIKDRYSSELALLLKALLWKTTVWDNSASYGGLLQNIRMIDARRGKLNKGVLDNPIRIQKLAFGFLTVFGSYIIQKLREHMELGGWNSETIRWKKVAYALFDKAEKLYSALDLVNLLIFLYDGKYPSLIFRACRIRLISSSRSLSREVSFEFLNRQLVWDEFTKFLLFVLPIIHLPRLKRRFDRLITAKTSKSSEAVGQLAFLPESTCAICYHQDSRVGGVPGADATQSIGMGENDITNPYAAVECGHIYCYVCLITQIEEQEGEGWTCLRCSQIVKNAKPWKNVELDEQVEKGDINEVSDEDEQEHGSSDEDRSSTHSGDWSKIQFETDLNVGATED